MAKRPQRKPAGSKKQPKARGPRGKKLASKQVLYPRRSRSPAAASLICALFASQIQLVRQPAATFRSFPPPVTSKETKVKQTSEVSATRKRKSETTPLTIINSLQWPNRSHETTRPPSPITKNIRWSECSTRHSGEGKDKILTAPHSPLQKTWLPNTPT